MHAPCTSDMVDLVVVSRSCTGMQQQQSCKNSAPVLSHANIPQLQHTNIALNQRPLHAHQALLRPPISRAGGCAPLEILLQQPAPTTSMRVLPQTCRALCLARCIKRLVTTRSQQMRNRGPSCSCACSTTRCSMHCHGSSAHWCVPDRKSNHPRQGRAHHGPKSVSPCQLARPAASCGKP